MSPTDHPALLSAQLLAVLGELDAGHGDLREAACLAGQLERLNPADGALGAARRQIEKASPQMLMGEPFDVQALAGEVLAAEDPDSAADALLALDEVCAGACFLGLTRDVKRAVRSVVAEVESSPASWSAQVPLARSVLSRCAPVEGDPAAAMWSAIAACPVAEDGTWGSVPLDGPRLVDPFSSSGAEPASVAPVPTESPDAGTPRPAPRRGLSIRRSGGDTS